MKKTICDICGKDMSTIRHVDDDIENMNFCMSSHGRIWDICTECRIDLNRWMTIRRKESENKDKNEGVSDTLTVTFDSSLVI